VLLLGLLVELITTNFFIKNLSTLCGLFSAFVKN
jgi:hypothetical protein